MPRRVEVVLDDIPYQYKNKSLRMTKAYTSQDYRRSTVLTDDVYTYVDFFFNSHKKIMKYQDSTNKAKYGDPNKYQYNFYWKQSMAFYNAAKTLPIESSPLASYYAMLNAVKALIAFREQYVDNFVTNFSAHGLNEDRKSIGESLDTIAVQRINFGVFVEFGRLMEKDFDILWPKKKSYSIKELIYNLSFLHRAYITTYTTPRSKKIPELFIPLQAGSCPMYYKANDNNLYLKFAVDPTHFSLASTGLPSNVMNTISTEFEECRDKKFMLKSVNGAKRNKDSISGELRTLNLDLRKQFQYIKSAKRLWYLKRSKISGSGVLNVNCMLIIMAVMHRFSEIVRYKPEQLERLMKSKENWLVHEFLSLALDQFIDEIAAEITGQDIMCTGVK
ncbi:MAG: YaaC family protein [Syntrophomonadaceae bacterium]|nr:YaaC family protein [Syntrophomonadaceae bacterium]MDD4548559.1 YaaC family protein [Syntrophomonadaceae bacterium]